MHPLARLGLWIAVGGLLAAVALAYFDPHLMVDLSSRLWACF